MISKRGALIVLEGCDRSGKSTQCRKLAESLVKRNILAETMSFPDRTTPTGKLIAQYLMKQIDLNQRAIHLLFSANRWELSQKIDRMLHDGITLIVDRYAYSGVAYSSVKAGMDLAWCKQSDSGLPRPDLVFLFTLSSDALLNRPGYGSERYESSVYQQKVAKLYMELKDDSWNIVDADNSIEHVHEILLTDVLKAIEKAKDQPLLTLW